jgi:hypothetical protein
VKAQVETYDKNIVALKAARKAVTLTARRVRELAKIAEAVYAPGTFKDVDVKPTKIPARKPAKKADFNVGKQMGATPQAFPGGRRPVAIRPV